MKMLKFLLAALLALIVVGASAGEVKKFDQATFDALAAANKPVVVVVHATWCPTCKAQDPIQKGLMKSDAFKDYTMLTLDFDADKPMLKMFKVTQQSTMIVFKGKTEVGRSVGDTTKSGIEGLMKKAA
jgi:thiol-disulfide isomerase/thioredoxin